MPTLSKEEIIAEIKKGSPLGLEIFKVELNHYLDLIKDPKGD